MNNKISIFVETGAKKVFAGAIDWPGWCRAGKSEADAVEMLHLAAGRYAEMLARLNIPFEMPAGGDDYAVVERVEGNQTTDFGAPNVLLSSDLLPITMQELPLSLNLLDGCWQTLRMKAGQYTGVPLRTGPRGGGRDLEHVLRHVIDSSLAYLSAMKSAKPKTGGEDWQVDLEQARLASLDALSRAVTEGVPERGPRGGKVWTPRQYLRRTAWHILDHAWEIEDRAS